MTVSIATITCQGSLPRSNTAASPTVTPIKLARMRKIDEWKDWVTPGCNTTIAETTAQRPPGRWSQS